MLYTSQASCTRCDFSGAFKHFQARCLYPGVASGLEQRGNAVQLLRGWFFTEHPDVTLTMFSQTFYSREMFQGFTCLTCCFSFFFLVVIAEMVFSVRKSLAGNA